MLKLLATPRQDFGKLVALGVVCGFYGMFFAIPLRKFYILRQRLIFPDATAVSIAIRTLHSSATAARRQIQCLAISFLVSFVWAICQEYAPGILQYWSFFYWISLFAGPGILAAHNWGWGRMEASAVMFGTGIIVGLNATLSFYFGCILAWGIIGPITVATGATTGTPGAHAGEVSYFRARKGSPRYWMLWPGVLIMLCASLTEIAVNYKVIGAGIKAGCNDLYNTIRKRPLTTAQVIADPASPADQVPIWVRLFRSTDKGLGFWTINLHRVELCYPPGSV